MNEALPAAIIIIVLSVVIVVAISRWIFRINGIVNRLDKIIEALTLKKKEEK